MYRLAGSRVNPKTNGPHRASGLPGTGIYSITLKKIADGSETAVKMPAQARISHVKFSPDGSHLAFLQTKDDAIELWVADGMTGAAKAVVTGADRVNATTGDPCDWLKDNVTLVCELVPSGRGPAPAEPLVPSGPHVEENYGKAAPAPTYEDLLKTAYDDTLFDYYFTSQLTAINAATGAKTRDRQAGGLRQRHAGAGRPAPAGDEDQEAVLAHGADERLRAGRRDLDARGRRGEEDRGPAVARRHRRSPASRPGPRGYRWRADQPATLLWVEALDGGDLKNKVPFRDKVRLARRAVLRPAGRDRQNGMALRRHQLHRRRHRAADRERSRDAPHAQLDHGAGRGAAQGVGAQAGRRLRRSGHRRSRGATPARTPAAAVDAAAPAAARSSRTATSSTSPASARPRTAIARSSTS